MEEIRRILLIIDPQVDFTTGSLKVNGGQDAMDRLAYWLLTTKTEFSTIVFTKDSHPNKHCSFIENGGSFPKHCVYGTHGSDIYEPVRVAIEVYCKEHKINPAFLLKGTCKDVEEFSALSSDENKKAFDKIMDMTNASEIWIAGLASDYCVLDTLKDIISVTKGTSDIVVMNNCTAAVDPNGPRQKEFINILNSPDVVGICEVGEVKR